MRKNYLVIQLLLFCSLSYPQVSFILDHNHIDLNNIPVNWIDSAKSKLHIAYGHASHGNQLMSGMNGIRDHFGSPYTFTENIPEEGKLDIHDYFSGDSHHLEDGKDDFWVDLTRTYLDDPLNSDVNVLMWAWSYGLIYTDSAGVYQYLLNMETLEQDYPQVTFIYHTGPVDGKGKDGVSHTNNELIRDFCKQNSKILYDFGDIESYDPDGNYYLDKNVDEECFYDSTDVGSKDANWAFTWCSENPGECIPIQWCSHTQGLNCQIKGQACWWLWARLAGWQPVAVKSIIIRGEGDQQLIDTDNGTLQLYADIYPDTATEKSVIWSVVDGSGSASIDKNGLLTAIENGTVFAVAVARDGSGVYDTYEITISNQIVSDQQISIEHFNLFPNPSKDYIIISTESGYPAYITISNIRGQILLLKEIDEPDQFVNLENLDEGVYIIHYYYDNVIKSAKIIKE